MQERFKQLLDEKGLTATKFASMIKVNASAMSHILNGRSKPGFDVLDKIAQAFPDVNLNWLVSGKGEMFNNHVSEEKRKDIPRQRSLFDEEEKKEPTNNSTAMPNPPSMPSSATLETEIAATIIQAPVTKKIKRIILFFDDGSFEDYSK